MKKDGHNPCPLARLLISVFVILMVHPILDCRYGTNCLIADTADHTMPHTRSARDHKNSEGNDTGEMVLRNW